MENFLPASFFDLAEFEHAGLFAPDRPVWEALGARMDEFIATWRQWEVRIDLPPGVHVLGGPISIAEECSIEPGAVLRGPLILGRGCEVRTGAYLRGGVIAGRGCVIGAHSEVKRSILLDRAHAPHQNYVGDSILGARVNLGAGTICSNVKNVGSEVTFATRDGVVHTGLRKLGAILGDGCRTGCNTVLNPGVLMGPGSVTYPNVALRSGAFPARTLVKLRQTQQIVVLDSSLLK